MGLAYIHTMFCWGREWEGGRESVLANGRIQECISRTEQERKKTNKVSRMERKPKSYAQFVSGSPYEKEKTYTSQWHKRTMKMNKNQEREGGKHTVASHKTTDMQIFHRLVFANLLSENALLCQ